MMPYYDEGLYICEVTEQGWQDTIEEPKRPMIVFRIQPVQQIGHDPEGNETFTPLARSEYDQTVRILVDSNDADSMDYAMAKLRYAGFTASSFSELNLVRATVRCRNTHDEYKGKMRDAFDLALPPRDQPEIAVIDSAMTRKLDALFGKRLKSTFRSSTGG